MHLTDHERFGRGLRLLGGALRPFVDRNLGADLAPGATWYELIQARQQQRLGRPYVVDPDDPRVLLRVLRDEWRGFIPQLSRVETGYASELLATANTWAHSTTLDTSVADRGLDTMILLLDSIDTDGEAWVGELRELLAAVPEVTASSTDAATADVQTDAGEREEEDLRVSSRVPEKDQLPPGASQVVLAVDGLDVKVTYRSSFNYALVSSQVPMLLAVELHNLGDTSVDVGQIEISVQGWAAASEVRPHLIDTAPVGPGQTLSIPNDRLRWFLSPTLFAHLDEAVTAELRVAVPKHRLQAGQAVTLLAADEWDATSVPEMLAAFVRSRDAGIQELLAEASQRLAARTGSASLEGYQSGRDRVNAIANAVYDAMQAREIRYIEPPASFEGTGQKIRTHREVLEDRWGTCIDLAVTFCAALEAAGISSILVVTEGHAFAGWLMQEELQLAEPALSDKSAMLLLAESGDFEAVELTRATQREQPVPFETAVGLTGRWWSRDADSLRWMLDVDAAHRRVRPLPTIRPGDGGVIEVVETVNAAAERRAPRDITTMPESQFPPRVEQWRRSLLDLTNMNPLLNLSPRRTGGAGIHVPRGFLGTLEDKIAAGQSFRLVAHNDLSDLHILQGARFAQDIDPEVAGRILAEERTLFVTIEEREYNSRLVRLQRRARTEAEEAGTNSLFLTLGSVVFAPEAATTSSFRSGKPVETSAPIFLIPVKLDGKRDTGFKVVIEDVDSLAMANECLAQKLRTQYGLEIPELADPGIDDSGIDIVGALQAIRSALTRRGIKGVAVEEDAHLGVFGFATLEMWRDLTNNWRKLVERPVVRHLVEKPGSAFEDETSDPEETAATEATTYLPIAADGSQLKAVRWAAAGKSFVLEGPPGTGKSQTITNLIANCLAEGKKVLFVAEKQAALEVVRKRLDSVGLSPFTLDLHGKKQTAGGVRSQLTGALETPTTRNVSFTALRDSYRSVVESLSKYPDQLHQKGPTGRSAWEARQLVLELEKRGAPSKRSLGTLPEVGRAVILGGGEDEIFQRARALGDAARELLGAPLDSPWSLAGPVDVAANGTAISAAVRALLAAEDAIADASARALLSLVATPGDLEHLSTWLDTVEEGLAFSSGDARRLVTAQWRQRVEQTMTAIKQFQDSHSPTLGIFEPAVLQQNLGVMVARSVEADRKMFKKKARRGIAADLAPITKPDAVLDLKTLTPQLRALDSTRAAAAELSRHVGELPGITVPYGWNPLAEGSSTMIQRQVDALLASAALVDAFPESAAELDAASAQVHEGAARGHAVGADAIRRLAQAWTELTSGLQSDDASFNRWLHDRSLTEALASARTVWERDLPAGLLELGRWARTLISSEAMSNSGLVELADAAMQGVILAEDVEYAARLSFARAELEERIDASGLRFFDEAQRHRETERFIQTGADVRERLRTELPAMIVGARTFDARRPMGRFGDFAAELAKKRRTMSTRALMRTYGSIITQLTPCVMMSPGSVARFLEPGTVDFDVVVFDEASQIRVPDAIGAMGRGGSVVIVGDSRQMPPSNAFQGNAATEDEEGTSSATPISALAAKDEVSILEQATAARLPSLDLTWHYRSRNESLIAFSNVHYYKSGLASFPAPPDLGDGSGLSLRRVDGLWEGGSRGARVNRVEADAVVREVQTILASSPERSIGVVTFNNQQQTLILDTLEALPDPTVRAALAREDEPLFVKNLENVQGDERDIILFTLAFSAPVNPDGTIGKVPTNWGPLSRSGGEKRLNVAITRAKERVLLFSSFEPESLDLATSSSTGLQHLKDYLIQARDGAEAADLVPSRDVDLHLDAVQAALEGAGYETKRSVGLSDFTVDLAVRAGDRPWIAILLDGEKWAARTTVGDREGMPQAVLVDAMSWAGVERVWLPTWLRDPEGVVERVAKAARAAEIQRLEPSSPTISLTNSVAEVDADEALVLEYGVEVEPDTDVEAALLKNVAITDPPVGLFGAESDAQMFTVASAAARHSKWILDNLAYPDNKRKVLLELNDIIDTEGPVLAGRLAKIVAARFGLERVREVRAEEILRLLPRSTLKKAPNGDQVAWPRTLDDSDYTSFRIPAAGARRNVDEVSFHELRNAMIAHARAAYGMRDADLLRATARTFGIQQLGSKVAQRLQGVLDAAIHTGALVRDGDHVVALR